MSKTAFLIEVQTKMGPMWYGSEKGSCLAWTFEAYWANHYTTIEEAQKVIGENSHKDSFRAAIVTEHGFYDNESLSKSNHN